MVLAPFEQALAAIHGEGSKAHKFLWMLRVRSSRSSLVKAYQQLTVADRKPIDYSSPAVQAAYIYAYAMPRAYFTSEMLRRHRNAIGKPLLPSGGIEVVSFGGGPASELVGLMDYLEDKANGESVTSISYRVFDKDGEWSTTAERVASALTCAIKVETTYEQLDLADRTKCATVGVSNADLIIFSYLMSELCSLNDSDQIAENFRGILSKMKTGAAMLFIDSLYPQFIQFFQRCRLYRGRQKNDDGEGVALSLPTLLPTFQTYRSALGDNPRMDAALVSKWVVMP